VPSQRAPPTETLCAAPAACGGGANYRAGVAGNKGLDGRAPWSIQRDALTGALTTLLLLNESKVRSQVRAISTMSSSDEAEFEGNDDSSEDMPLADLKTESPSKKRRTSSQGVSYAEDNDDNDDDSEDDVPLSALKGPSPKKKKTATNGTKKKAPAAKKAKTPTKKVTAAKKKETSTASSTKSSSDYKTASAALYGSDCQKGLLIQRLLCRWWYAIAWPDQAAIPDKPPPNYDALDGFEGVYVCTKGDDVGAIKDFRDKDKCPSFKNMAKKSSEELQTLVIKALTEQRRQLIEAEGSGTPTEKELTNLLKWANKVKHSTADKDAVKVLKAAKLTLAE
jgi:hypothetical protein